MSKWVDIEDREFPQDVPREYFFSEDYRHLRSYALTPLLISLIRRIDELEAKLRKMESRT